MDMSAIKKLSRPALLDVIEFVLFSKVVDNKESLNQSLQSLSRRLLKSQDVDLIRCDNSGQSLPINFNSKNSRMDYALPETICLDALKQIKLKDNRKLSECGDNTKKSNKLCECLKGMLSNKSVCVVSSNKEVDSAGANVLNSLMPYMEDAFLRVEPPKDVGESKEDANGDNIYLTPRETEVLSWVSLGKRSWETGKIIGISERTVKFHLQNIYRKLDVGNVAQAITQALKYNLISN